MAFPTVISTLINPYHHVGGPFVSSNGAVYVFTRSSGGGGVQVFKATDPETSFAGVSSLAMASGNTIRQLDAFKVDDIIHVVTRDAAALNSNVLRYHAYNMGTDAWDTSNELIRTTYTIPQLLDESVVRIRVRSDGSKIVLYEGPQVLADIQRARVYYARHLGVGWSVDVQVSGSGNAHWYPGDAVLGSADRIHFFFEDLTNFDGYQRCLTSANSLETLPSAFDASLPNSDVAPFSRGVAYSGSAGGTVVRFPYFKSFGPDTINDARFTSVDAPAAMTITSNTTSITSGAGSSRNHISFAADGNVVYAAFENDADDLYVISSQDAGAWSSPVLLQTSQINGKIFANVYNRPATEGSRVLGVVYYNSVGDQVSYIEHTLSAFVAAPSVSLPSLGLLGVGR